MTYDPAIHHRRSIRLKGYDYSRAGAYFGTICTQDRAHLFGRIVDGKVVLNAAGQMVQSVWDDIPKFYPGIEIDAFVAMPNHAHGIVIVGDDDGDGGVGATPRGCPDSGVRPDLVDEMGADIGGKSERGHPRGGAPTASERPTPEPAPTGSIQTRLSLSDIVHRFKTMTTKRYSDGVKQHGWKPFHGKLWQRNYWEHIIRNEQELYRIQNYIDNNPAKWESDCLFRQSSGGLVFQIKESGPEYGSEAWMV